LYGIESPIETRMMPGASEGEIEPADGVCSAVRDPDRGRPRTRWRRALPGALEEEVDRHGAFFGRQCPSTPASADRPTGPLKPHPVPAEGNSTTGERRGWFGGIVSETILLVEDDPAQALLVGKVLDRARLDNPVEVAPGIAEAFAYLEHVGNGTPPPVLVLLDMHLPTGSGLVVLERIRARPDLADVPVIVLSASTESDDIERAFGLGADTYLVKPVAFDALVDAVNDLGFRWAIIGRERAG
jgi:CheY-like chemotaxis protein